MKTNYYKLKLIVLLFFTVQLITAQKFDKKYHESFKVNKDVVISLNTYYTDVVIETWNRNTVDVKATITVEGKDIKQEDADKYFKNWQFEALGNHQKITIKGNNHRHYGALPPLAELSVIPEVPEIPELPELPELPEMPELSIKNLDILDSAKLVAPLVNNLIVGSMNLKLDSLQFDFDAYKKDKNYLKKYQKKAKETSLKLRNQYLKDTLARKKRILEMKKAMAKVKVEMAKQRKEYLLQRKEYSLHKKEIRDKQLAVAKKIRAVLVKRKKVKLKKTIYLKVPKGAKFNMNVSYGSVKLPS